MQALGSCMRKPSIAIHNCIIIMEVKMEEQRSWHVDFYLDARDRNPVLEAVSVLPKQEQAKLFRVLDLLRNRGPELGMPYARHVEDKVWELRADAGRIFYCIYTGQRIILLHYYTKKTNKSPKREIDTARRRIDEFSKREMANDCEDSISR